MKDAAYDLVARGFAVFPCAPFSKVPAIAGGFRSAVTTRDGVERLWGRQRWLNVGIATGERSGVFVLDVDGAIGAASVAALEQRHGSLPATLECQTPNGRHLYFAWPGQRVPTSQGRLGPKLDIRGDGGCCIAPPSVHPCKRRYRWLDETVPIAPAPAWVVMLAATERERIPPHPSPNWGGDGATRNWSAEVAGMLACLSPDCPREAWIRVGMALHAGGIPFEVWDRWSEPGETYDARETQRQWRSFRVFPGGISLGTLVHLARRAGWQPSRSLMRWNETRPARPQPHPLHNSSHQVAAA